MTHGLPILVEFYIGKYRQIWQKVRKILTHDLIISKGNGYRDSKFCMCIPYVVYSCLPISFLARIVMFLKFQMQKVEFRGSNWTKKCLKNSTKNYLEATIFLEIV